MKNQPDETARIENNSIAKISEGMDVAQMSNTNRSQTRGSQVNKSFKS